MKREILLTADGSHTIKVDEHKVSYHSKHGAIQESTHVFIEAALKYVQQNNSGSEYNILEIGFGTGLNALLTAIYTAGTKMIVNYHSLEPFPIQEQEIAMLNYGILLHKESVFTQLHDAPWDTKIAIHPNFSLHKYQTTLQSFTTNMCFHAIYYDAFAPSAQPELWTTEAFTRLFNFLVPGGLMVTYCSKTVVRKSMEAAGFRVTKIPGPYGKREMVRAFRDH